MPRSLAVLQYAIPDQDSLESSNKNAYIVPELLYLGQALKRNWDTFAQKMQKALEKKQIESSDLRALQDAFVLLWHRQGAFQFDTSEEARQYTQTLYALMTRAQLHLPPEISGAKVDQYVANIKKAGAFVSKPAPGLAGLTIDVSAYRNKLQTWAPRLWVGFVALTVTGAGAAALALGLVTGGLPLALVAIAVISWAAFTLIEKRDGSLSRTNLFADMLARNTSGLYDKMKKPGLKNLGLSAFVLGVLGLAVFAPMVGMIASGLAVFGLVAFMALSVVANGFHNNASLFNAGRNFLEKHIKWFRFGATDIRKDAMPDMQKIKKHSESNGALELEKVLSHNIKLMTSKEHMAAKMNSSSSDKIIQNFKGGSIEHVYFCVKNFSPSFSAPVSSSSAPVSSSSAPALVWLIPSEDITVEPYRPKSASRRQLDALA